MGSMNEVLSKLEDDGTPCTNEVLLECAMQVCDGMAHLAEIGIVHRDLALRNVLCFSFDRESRYEVRAKITDFGMAKEGGYVRLTTSSVGGGLPFRWMSPEAILRHSVSVDESRGHPSPLLECQVRRLGIRRNNVSSTPLSSLSVSSATLSL